MKITLKNGDNEWFRATDFPPSLMTPAIQKKFAQRTPDVRRAMSSGNNQYAIIPSMADVNPLSTNYSSPIDVQIPTPDAHYAEFGDAEQLMEMNQLATTTTIAAE